MICDPKSLGCVDSAEDRDSNAIRHMSFGEYQPHVNQKFVGAVGLATDLIHLGESSLIALRNQGESCSQVKVHICTKSVMGLALRSSNVSNECVISLSLVRDENVYSCLGGKYLYFSSLLLIYLPLGCSHPSTLTRSNLMGHFSLVPQHVDLLITHW